MNGLEVRSAWGLLNDHRSSPPNRIVTFSQQLDQVLNGGPKLGQLTELVGHAGAGKTQLCLQLSVNCQIAPQFGGLGAEVLFLDTESSFRTDRLKSIAQAVIDHCQAIAEDDNQKKLADAMTVDRIFSKVHYKKCLTLHDLANTMFQLKEFVQRNNVKLIIIDSITAPFRYQEIADPSKEAGPSKRKNGNKEAIMDQLRLKMSLLDVALQQKVAVVMTNHMTTRFEDGVGYQCPAMGRNFGCDSAVRILLRQSTNYRWARIIKSVSLCNGKSVALFAVTKDGVRDAENILSETEAEVLCANDTSELASQSASSSWDNNNVRNLDAPSLSQNDLF